MKSISILYPKVSAESWAKTYGLIVKSHSCYNCGKNLVANVPFATKRWRGLISPKHECGESYDFSTAVEIDQDDEILWKDFYYNIKEIL